MCSICLVYGSVLAGGISVRAQDTDSVASRRDAVIQAAYSGVIGEIIRVGYPTVRALDGGSDIVRHGSWVPIVVDLSLDGGVAFDGWLRLSQSDKDGDLVYDEQKVQLLPNQSRRFTLYALADGNGDRNAAQFFVEVLNGDGDRVSVSSRGSLVWGFQPASPVEVISSDAYVVLSVTDQTSGRVGDLYGRTSDSIAKDVYIVHIAPREMPTRWFGLDLVDAVVWDGADPSQLTPAQQNALVTWTRHGGRLILATGQHAESLVRSSPIGPLLPVTVDGVLQTLVIERLSRIGLQRDGAYPVPVTVAICTPTSEASWSLKETFGGTGKIVGFGPFGGIETALVSRCRIGRGHLFFVAASMSDITRGVEDVTGFFKRLFELRSPDLGAGFERASLFDEISGSVGFREVGAIYLAVALLFAGLYVFVATFGSWSVLKHKGWIRHSWSVFAVLAAVASVCCVIGVTAVRGVGRKLMQISVVDGVAGETKAYGSAYFGLKTSMFDAWDVWIPDDILGATEPELTSCFLKPLPDTIAAGASSAKYIDPGRYKLRSSSAELLKVPIRGTVKQFEGRWEGNLSGRVVVNMSLVDGGGGRYDFRVSAGSTIRNDLGFDLDRCYLIYTTRNIFLPTGVSDIERAGETYIFPLGSIGDGVTITPEATLYRDSKGMSLTFDEWSDLYALDVAQQGWADRFISLDFRRGRAEWSDLSSEQVALLLATLLGDYSPPESSAALGRFVGRSFSVGSCRRLDWSTQLNSETAMLVGFSRSSGPMGLCIRKGRGAYERVLPDRSLTMIRMLIPLNNTSSERLADSE